MRAGPAHAHDAATRSEHFERQPAPLRCGLNAAQAFVAGSDRAPDEVLALKPVEQSRGTGWSKRQPCCQRLDRLAGMVADRDQPFSGRLPQLRAGSNRVRHPIAKRRRERADHIDHAVVHGTPRNDCGSQGKGGGKKAAQDQNWFGGIGKERARRRSASELDPGIEYRWTPKAKLRNGESTWIALRIQQLSSALAQARGGFQSGLQRGVQVDPAA